MKIACMIGSEAPPLVYFANHIHAHCGLSLLIIEQEPEKPTMVESKSMNNSLLNRAVNYAKFRLELWDERRKEKQRAINQKALYNQIYGDDWQRIDTNIQVLYTSSVNSPEVIAALTELKPDLILDHGTTIVKKETIATAPLTLNLHWGLSPYYRGVESTLHALLNCDPLNIGVTVHKLSAEIDGGDILAQERVEVFEQDNADTIPPRLTLQGVRIICRAIEYMKNGGNLLFETQKSAEGFLFRDSHWNKHTHQFGKGMQPAHMKAILRHPARKALPIVSASYLDRKEP